MKLGNLLRLCDGGQIHDLIFFQQQRTKPRERIELRGCQRQIQLREQTL